MYNLRTRKPKNYDEDQYFVQCFQNHEVMQCISEDTPKKVNRTKLLKKVEIQEQKVEIQDHTTDTIDMRLDSFRALWIREAIQEQELAEIDIQEVEIQQEKVEVDVYLSDTIDTVSMRLDSFRSLWMKQLLCDKMSGIIRCPI